MSVRPWRSAFAAVVLVAATTGACAQGRSKECTAAAANNGCVRVLFIGNSYTFVNNLPGTFAAVAGTLDHGVYADMIAPGGATLADHLNSPEALALIRSGHWTYVVLQEQSLVPAATASRVATMYPAARHLVEVIRQSGAEPVFFQTWGREHGWSDGHIADFATMQDSVTSGYQAIAAELNVRVVPVGEAWRIVRRERSDIPLYQPDGSHPTVQGTFVAANTFVAALFNETPRGVGARGGVPASQVSAIQQAAVRAVKTVP